MQFLLFLVLILLLAAVLYTKKETLSSRMKKTLIGSMVVLLASAIGYESYQSSQSEQRRLIVNAFKQGKTLTCQGGVTVDFKRFIYVNGTQSFIPNEINEYDKGTVIEVSTCRILP